MKYEKYLVKKGKTDLLSSLQALDKKILDKKMKEYNVNDIYELKDYILTFFEYCLNEAKDDEFTKAYFESLMNNENSKFLSVYEQDIKLLIIFLYNKGDYYSYYIPVEIKQIIDKILYSTTIEDFNLANAANTPIVKDLRGLLETIVVTDLKHVGKLLNIEKLSNKPKRETINMIYKALTDANKLTELIKGFTDKEFTLLKDLISNKGTIQDNNISVDIYHVLYMTCLVFIFRRENKFYISMTDDVYNIIKDIDLNKIQKTVDQNTKTYYLARSMVELYGAIPYSSLEYYYNLYYGNKLDIPDNIPLLCERNDYITSIRINNKEYLIHKILQSRDLEQLLKNIILRHKTIKRKPFKLNELLKYSNYDYYEKNKSKDQFKKYLEKENISADTIEIILKIISDMYRLGNDFISGTIEMLQEYGVEITEENINEILDYLVKIYNNSRIWVNNGWTPIEMRTEYK